MDDRSCGADRIKGRREEGFPVLAVLSGFVVQVAKSRRDRHAGGIREGLVCLNHVLKLLPFAEGGEKLGNPLPLAGAEGFLLKFLGRQDDDPVGVLLAGRDNLQGPGKALLEHVDGLLCDTPGRGGHLPHVVRVRLLVAREGETRADKPEFLGLLARNLLHAHAASKVKRRPWVPESRQACPDGVVFQRDHAPAPHLPAGGPPARLPLPLVSAGLHADKLPGGELVEELRVQRLHLGPGGVAHGLDGGVINKLQAARGGVVLERLAVPLGGTQHGTGLGGEGRPIHEGLVGGHGALAGKLARQLPRPLREPRRRRIATRSALAPAAPLVLRRQKRYMRTRPGQLHRLRPHRANSPHPTPSPSFSACSADLPRGLCSLPATPPQPTFPTLFFSAF